MLTPSMSRTGKPIVWLHGQNWRIIHHLDRDAVVILDVFAKKSTATPAAIIGNCQRRLTEHLRTVHARWS
jgi:phage-related protein